MAFEFTGKIDSATFVDRQNTVIEILFKRDDELHVYNLPVDYGAADFKEFLSEWSLEQVEQETRNTRRAADEAFDKMIQGRIADAMAKGQADLDEQDKRRYIIAQKTLDEQDKKRWMLAQKTLDKQDKDRYDHFQKEMEIYKLKLEADIDKTDRERYELAEAYKKELEHHADLIDKKRYDLADEYKKALEEKVDKNERERIELWRLNNPTSTKLLAPSDLLMFADQFNENKNFLFDLKLSIFEDPIVASNKDKQTKLAIRKSKNIYEVLELYCKIKRLQAYKNVL